MKGGIKAYKAARGKTTRKYSVSSYKSAKPLKAVH